MFEIAASTGLTTSFVFLTALVVATDVVAARLAAPRPHGQRWALAAALFFSAWMIIQAGLAASGVLEAQTTPPPLLPFLAANLLVALAVGLSPIGRRFSLLPLGLLVGLQAFRLPLELFLHALYEEGQLPVQMTWSGRNFDVVTGALALVLGVVGVFRPLPRAVVWAFAVLGSALLVNVVGTALLSAPLPFRVFTNDPPVVLPYSVPWTWIVSVHVWTAVTGHVILFRALLRPGEARQSAGDGASG